MSLGRHHHHRAGRLQKVLIRAAFRSLSLLRWSAVTMAGRRNGWVLVAFALEGGKARLIMKKNANYCERERKGNLNDCAQTWVPR